MIYGANGYTGQLISKLAAEKGHKPILAGRREGAIRPFAESLGLPWKVFEISEIDSHLKGMGTVLLCAGPFSATSSPFVAACLRQGVHYLDITGEIEVLENVLAHKKDAEKAEVVLLPGVGFDVVPSDCLAAQLSQKLPDADSLELAFITNGKPSPGTLKTMIENMPKGGKIRANGKIVSVPEAYRQRQVSFNHLSFNLTSIPWGDISTAYHSTGIPNITVYTYLPQALSKVGKLVKSSLVRTTLKKLVEIFVHGPSEEELRKNRCSLWGRVSNASGKAEEARLEIPDGYYFTAQSALACVENVRSGKVKPGAWTPSQAFGAEFVHTLL